MTEQQSQEQRRKYGRFTIRAHASLIVGEENWPAHLLNLSVGGALVALTDAHDLQAGKEVGLTILLNESAHLEMQGQVIHVKNHYVGLECTAKSDEDQALLRELIGKFSEDGDVPVDY